VHREESGTTHSFWMCSVLVNDATQRDGLRQHLREQGVETRPVFYPAHTMPHCQAEGVFPVAEYLGARGINLPSFPALAFENVQDIAKHLRLFFENFV
jgi:perosamine synthetase